MANRLRMDIQRLKRQGWSGRKIARELGIYRKTVRRYASSGAKCANVLTSDGGVRAGVICISDVTLQDISAVLVDYHGN